MATNKRRSSAAGESKVKLIAVIAVLAISLAWVVYFLIPPSKKPSAPSGAALQQYEAEQAKIEKEIEELRATLPPSVTNVPKAGS